MDFVLITGKWFKEGWARGLGLGSMGITLFIWLLPWDSSLGLGLEGVLVTPTHMRGAFQIKRGGVWYRFPVLACANRTSKIGACAEVSC